jgi:hypothetical protein
LFKRWAIPVLVVSALLMVALVGPASASDVSFSGAVTPGSTFEIRCPEGERASESETGYQTSATFYKNGRRVVASFTDGAGATEINDAFGFVVGFAYPVPRKANFVEATLVCEPIPTMGTAGMGGSGTASDVFVPCPAYWPYLVSVQEVVYVSPSTGEVLGSWGYTTTENGVIVDALSHDFDWRVTMTCSALPPS